MKTWRTSHYSTRDAAVRFKIAPGRAKAKSKRAALRRRLSGLATVEPPDQGMHLVLHLANGLSDVTIQRAAFNQRVVTRAMSELYLAAPPRSALMLGFSGHPASSIPSAVARLAAVIEDAAG